MNTFIKNYIYFIYTLLFYQLGWADPTEISSPFFFLANNSQVKLLGQTLEYRVIENSVIQVGDLIISNKNLRLFLDNRGKIVLEGPLQLMVGGTLIIKDPLGKALWRQVISSPKSLEIQQREELKNSLLDDQNSTNLIENQKLRAQSGRYWFGSIDDLESTLNHVSYFNFCIYTETNSHRIQTCSENYVLKGTDSRKAIGLLKSKDTANMILVNGVEVNEHGIIQFNKNTSSIALTVKLSSGILLEIKTQSIEMELLDILYEPKDSKVYLKLRDKSNSNSETNTWSTWVPLKQRFLYIEAFGQVPLRQDLSLETAELPVSEDKPLLLNNIFKTYSPSIDLEFQDNNIKKIRPITKGDQIKKTNGSYLWAIKNLNYNQLNRHVLELESNKKKLFIGIELDRNPSWDISVAASTGSSITSSTSNSSTENNKDSLQSFNLAIDKYFEGLFGATNSFNHLRWGLHSQLSQTYLQKSKQRGSLINADLSYRLNESFHHQDSSFSLRLSYYTQHMTDQKNNESNINRAWIGLRIHHDGKNQWLKQIIGDFHDLDLSYYPHCLNTDCRKLSFYDLHWQSRFIFIKNYYWKWSLEYQNLISELATNKNTVTNINFGLGLGSEF